MSGLAPCRPLPLPRMWPRRVRSAAVHAISVADFALTTALGWAAQSLNPRLRLRADIERLRQEIQLLCEEIRIKDARMQHIAPQKRRSPAPADWTAAPTAKPRVTPEPGGNRLSQIRAVGIPLSNTKHAKTGGSDSVDNSSTIFFLRRRYGRKFKIGGKAEPVCILRFAPRHHSC